jgi:hypothetical protein
MKYLVLLFIIMLPVFVYSQTNTIYTGFNGSVSFTSDAPLELIKAQSIKLSCAINTTDKSFVFSIPMSSFEGFNSSLQRTHFNENYVESPKYPKTTFDGKIIEDIDFGKPGTYQVRAKGNLEIHGIKQQRIIKSTLIINKGSMKIKSTFTVPLTDHKIQIPAIVKQKIAEEIYVTISIDLVQKK